jgi:hypothetical protein
MGISMEIRMYRKASLVCFAAVAFAASLAAKPNFSGTWTLNVSKSDFGMLPGPTSRMDVVEHSDPSLKVTTKAEGPQGSQNSVANYTIDGQEVTNEQGPMTLKSKLRWDGDNLVVDSTTNVQGNDVTIKTVWTLSADGQTLTESAHLAAAALGETDQKLVFEKGTGAAAPAATATATTGAAGARANYSGTWKLNVDKSDFGPLPPSASRTDIIVHSDPGLKDTVSDDGAQGKQDYVLTLTTDGKEATNNLSGLEAKSIANWTGANLVVETKLNIQGTDIALKAVWILSPDGKTLTQNAHIVAGPLGELDQKMVFEKQ